MYDTIIAGGTVIDGTGAAGRPADVGIQRERITAVGDLSQAQASRRMDATGMAVAPGFVDVHNHSDGWLLKTPHLVSKTTQGFTTEVIMADGISYAPVNRHTAREWIYYMRGLNALRFEDYTGWESLADYMALLDRRNVQNSITHIPYANLRTLACGWGRGPVDDVQMTLIQEMVAQGMAQGACGLSTGLDYVAQCFSTTDELVEACRPMADAQGLYVSHVRYKKGSLAGVQEAVEIGRRAGVPVHISHLKGTSPEMIHELMTYIDTVAVNEVSFSFDVYPYLPGSTMLNYMLPYEVWTDGPLGVTAKLMDPGVRDRFAHTLAIYDLDLEAINIAWLPSKENSPYQGRTLREYVESVGKPAADALCDLLIEENLAVLLVFHQGDDQLVEPFLAHPCYMMGTDGIYHEDAATHPRQFGSAARLLGPLVRKGLFSLEEAVRKLSGYPAQRFGLTDRGVIAEGKYADLVIFDPQTVQDRATFADSQQLSSGVEQVLVNGMPIVVDGAPVLEFDGDHPGRALRFNQSYT